MCLLVCGGNGFIGANFILQHFHTRPLVPLVNVDKLSYAGQLRNLSSLPKNMPYTFVHGDITQATLLQKVFAIYKPSAVLNFAAETHVDRAIFDPQLFVYNNVMGTSVLLATAYHFWKNLSITEQNAFRFVQVSTDEVYGSLEAGEDPFTEQSPFCPRNPYSASKASGDHIVAAYYSTFAFPSIGVHCSNNYGPLQFPEKLIPFMISRAVSLQSLPVYGDGRHVRDWIYVHDHCEALRVILESGRPGERYNVGASCEKSNLELVETVCTILDELKPRDDGLSYTKQITFVKDRPGHDRRYALNSNKIAKELSYKAKETFDSGIHKTIQWYLEHPEHLKSPENDPYTQWAKQHYTK